MVRVIIDGMSDQDCIFDTWREAEQLASKMKGLAPWIKEIRIRENDERDLRNSGIRAGAPELSF